MSENLENRLTKLETLLEIAMESREFDRERLYKFASELSALANQLEMLKKGFTDLEKSMEDDGHREHRIASLEEGRAQVRTVWQIIRWVAAVVVGFFTVAMAIGEKLSKLISGWGV